MGCHAYRAGARSAPQRVHVRQYLTEIKAQIPTPHAWVVWQDELMECFVAWLKTKHPTQTPPSTESFYRDWVAKVPGLAISQERVQSNNVRRRRLTFNVTLHD